MTCNFLSIFVILSQFNTPLYQNIINEIKCMFESNSASLVHFKFLFELFRVCEE